MQQFTDRAFESAFVLGFNPVTLLGPKSNYVGIPLGDSICLIEALVNNLPNGEWEVSAGVRTGNTFTRDTVIASSNAGASVNFSGETTEIALVVSSEFYESISAAVTQNTVNIGLNADDIVINKANITTNTGNISNNAGNINQNAIDIAQNADDISNKENSLSNPTQDGQGLVSTALGVRSWIDLVHNFVDLLDTPADYIGQEGKLIKVNATADGLIFGDPSGTTVSWGDITGILSNQTDLQAALNAKLDTTGTAANSLLLQGGDGAFYLDRTNQTGIQTPDTVSFPNVGATDLIDLAHFYDHAWSAGVTDISGAVVDGGGCTVNIPAMEVTFRTGASDHDPLIAYHINAQAGLVIGAGNAGTVYVDYNGGSPIFGFKLAGSTKLDLRTRVPLAVVACDGTNTMVLSISKYNTDSTGLLVRRLIDLGLAHVPGGTVLGEAGIRNISITAGLFYLGLQSISNDAFDSSVTDTFTYWYKDGVGGWSSQANQTQISNTLYDDGSGILAPILNNDYSQSWVYINGEDSGFNTHVLYGDLSVNTESDVLTTNPPAEIPPILAFLGVLVGRVVIQEAIDPFVLVESAFSEEYKPGSATAHNNLPGLQGGALDDYYHVKADDLGYFGTLPAQLAAKVSNIVAGTGIAVDATDPENPIVSATGGGVTPLQLEEESLLTSLLLR